MPHRRSDIRFVFGHPWGFRFTARPLPHFRDHLPALRGDAADRCPINSGNSGGPLISLVTGRVVGINTASMAKLSDRRHQLCRPPMPYACAIVDLLKKGEDPSPPAVCSISRSTRTRSRTLVVACLRLPAGAIDPRAGDELLALRSPDRALENQSDLMHALRGKLDDVTLSVRRDGAQAHVALGTGRRHRGSSSGRGSGLLGRADRGVQAAGKPPR